MNINDVCFAGSILILVIIALRAAVLYRVPRQTFVALWIIAAVRLLIPVQIPSVLSVYTLFQPAVNLPGPSAVQTIDYRNLQPVHSIYTPVASADTAVLSAVDIWGAVWLAGTLATAAVFAFTYARWLHRFAVSLPADDSAIHSWMETHPLRRTLSIRRSEWIASPLTYGLIRPVILLPNAYQGLSSDTLQCILTHEYSHVRRFDTATKLLLIAAVCVHWFNPLVWLMFVLANRDIEHACDEAVLNSGVGRADYANMLIRMEEQRRSLIPFCCSFSRSELKERIHSIMKSRKYTMPALILSAVSVVCVGTAFATSPPHDAAEPETVIADAIVREEPDGSSSYSIDGGQTFVNMPDGVAVEQYVWPEVEWWTAEEYESWLESEKIALQELLGTKAWTSSDGEFVWTQEKIDETIAMYEETLHQIRSGMRISKSISGSDDVLFSESSADDAASFEEYEPFGLTRDESGTLWYNGVKVRFFTDSVEIEPGMIASRRIYYSKDGTVDVRTERRASQNADGSTDPFGDLTGIEQISDSEAEQLIEAYILTTADEQIALTAVEEQDVYAGAAETDAKATESALRPYENLGLTWNLGTAPGGKLSMYWNSHPVHCIYDQKRGSWIANNMNGADLPDSALHLEAVYTNGALTGLQPTAEKHPEVSEAYSLQQQTAETHSEISQASSFQQQGTTFETLFERYKPFGLVYKTDRKTGSVRYNLFYHGKPVNHFADVSDTGVFTFDSADQKSDGITVFVVYENGRMTGLRAE